MKKRTINTLLQQKGVKPITMITAYDALFAKLFDDKVDMILVGDSLNMSFLGESDTLSATMDQMIYHTKAVCNGAKSAYIVCDMPFGSYMSPAQALENSIRVYQETKADAVKIEGGEEKTEIIRHLTDNGITVVGHIGLMPQMARAEGGYLVKGKDETSQAKILADAKAVVEAGAKFLVVEGVKTEVATLVTQTVPVPVIGIGAGNQTDGQVLVWSDMLGFFQEFTPKFVKQYLDGATLVQQSVEQYVQEVEARSFPAKEHSY